MRKFLVCVFILFFSCLVFSQEKSKTIVGIGSGGQSLMGIDFFTPITPKIGVQVGAGIQLGGNLCYSLGATYSYKIIDEKDKIFLNYINQGNTDKIYFKYVSLSYLYQLQPFLLTQIGVGCLIDSKIDYVKNTDKPIVLIASIGFSQDFY